MQKVKNGLFDPEAYFGGINLDELPQAFEYPNKGKHTNSTAAESFYN